MSSSAIPITKAGTFARGFSPETRRIFWLIVVALGIIAPTVAWGIPSSRDFFNHYRFAVPFYEAIQHGHLYPSWLADSNSGYGDASFRFYPPAVYYLLAAARALTGSWYVASLAAFALLSVAGALGIYFWAKQIVPGHTAMWAGIFYTLAPYHLNQLYQSFLLAEFAASAALPFAFAFIERICRRGRARDIGGLAAACAVLILTHLPLTVISSIALLVYALLRIDSQKRMATVLKLGLAALLGLTASACYWVTMVAEMGWIRADNIKPDPSVDYRLNFVFSTFSSDYLNVWWMNILSGFMFLMFWPALVLWRSARKEDKGIRGLGSVTILLGLTVFMMTPLSRPLWNLVRPLQQTQFPWRWLALSSMFGSILVATSLPYWASFRRGKNRYLFLLAAGSIALSLAFSLSHIVREAHYLSAPEFQTALSSIPGSPSVTQWLPVWAKEQPRNMEGRVESKGRAFSIESWEPAKRVLNISAGAAEEVRVRSYYYPYWVAKANSKLLTTRPDEDGALLISVPGETASVVLEFEEPTRTHVAGLVTGLGWMLIFALFCFPLRLTAHSRSQSHISNLRSEI